jgi:hypothetical protein
VARFPFPPHGRNPNFAGAEAAAARLLDIEPWKSAIAIKVNPDPQRRCEPKRCDAASPFFVPTPRLHGSFKKLEPRRILPDKIDEAASLSRGDRWSDGQLGSRLMLRPLVGPLSPGCSRAGAAVALRHQLRHEEASGERSSLCSADQGAARSSDHRRRRALDRIRPGLY